jgi:hypothetical protein
MEEDYMLSKEDILRNLQEIWNRDNNKYSEDGFKEYVEEYCMNNFEDGYFTNEDGETEYIADWVLHNLDLT